jgi:DNA polymerase-1
MNPDLRRRAKTINFGIVYGISAFGLAVRLGIPQGEAAAFIKQYFRALSGHPRLHPGAEAAVPRAGFCHHPVRPRLPLPRHPRLERVAARRRRRQAINAPIQGSAADIIRRAMMRMDSALDAAKLNVRMLLQVHDELVFEAPDEEVERALPVIRRVMEDAPLPAVRLSVPWRGVDARAAANWEEAH